MEVDKKVDGFGKFLIGWTAAFLLLMLVLALSCMPPENPENGAICMTPEMLQKTMDQCCTEGYANGYAKAKAEQPKRADVELNLITKDKLTAFLNLDQCDRCMSDVYNTANSCLARAECLLASARSHGWDAYGVVINFEGADGGAHALVAFPLKDGTLVYVEPWYDTLEVVEVGKPYRPAHKIIEEMGILK
jgi:hypothetical protein